MGRLNHIIEHIGDETSPDSGQNTTPESRLAAARQFRWDLDNRPEYKHLTEPERKELLGILDAVEQETRGLVGALLPEVHIQVGGEVAAT